MFPPGFDFGRRAGDRRRREAGEEQKDRTGRQSRNVEENFEVDKLKILQYCEFFYQLGTEQYSKCSTPQLIKLRQYYEVPNQTSN